MNVLQTNLRRRHILIAPCKRSAARGRGCPLPVGNCVVVQPTTGLRGGSDGFITPRYASLARGYSYSPLRGQKLQQFCKKINQRARKM